LLLLDAIVCTRCEGDSEPAGNLKLANLQRKRNEKK
jgi:hypothetical protein